MPPITQAQKDEFPELGFIRLDNAVSPDELAWLREPYAAMFDPTNESGPVYKQLGGIDDAGRDALPHSPCCMHYAAPNRSDRARRAYLTVFEAERKPLRPPLRFL